VKGEWAPKSPWGSISPWEKKPEIFQSDRTITLTNAHDCSYIWRRYLVNSSNFECYAGDMSSNKKFRQNSVGNQIHQTSRKNEKALARKSVDKPSEFNHTQRQRELNDHTCSCKYVKSEASCNCIVENFSDEVGIFDNASAMEMLIYHHDLVSAKNSLEKENFLYDILLSMINYQHEKGHLVMKYQLHNPRTNSTFPVCRESFILVYNSSDYLFKKFAIKYKTAEPIRAFRALSDKSASKRTYVETVDMFETYVDNFNHDEGINMPYNAATIISYFLDIFLCRYGVCVCIGGPAFRIGMSLWILVEKLFRTGR